jgi:hypothetical protein
MWSLAGLNVGSLRSPRSGVVADTPLAICEFRLGSFRKGSGGFVRFHPGLFAQLDRHILGTHRLMSIIERGLAAINGNTSTGWLSLHY